MAVTNILLAVPLTTLNAAAIAGAYQPINPNGLPEACVILRIVNAQTMPVTISYDGVTDHDFIGANSFFDLNAQANSIGPNFICKIKKGTKVYARGAAGVGTLALAAYFQPEGG